MQVTGGGHGGEQASPLGRKRKDEVIVHRARLARARDHTWPVLERTYRSMSKVSGYMYYESM